MDAAAGSKQPPPLDFQGDDDVSERVSRHGLDAQGIETAARLHWNLTTAPLVEQAIARGEGELAKDGPLVVKTGKHTGRSANDKFIVRDAETERTVWWGKSNKPMDAGGVRRAQGRFPGASEDERHPVRRRPFRRLAARASCQRPRDQRVAWHNLFIRTMLVRPERPSWRASCPSSRSSTCRASAPTRRGTAAAAKR